MRTEKNRSLRLLALILTAAASPLAAQRAPVLQQVKVRHPYYFREMLVPQVTSGPSSVAWSPDGSELVYSMQGSLWRQQVGSAEAQQLTDGPGYDYQPDWSPDGRRIVYASYRDDAIELRLLDPSTGKSTALVGDGAVNVEPRWSPDGGRIAFTSTRYEGRWHVFVAEIGADGRAGEVTRVSEDRESGLPRYYYNTVDQYLSPAWSPDGRELLVVSNRGHIWGAGTIWRMPARSGGMPREIRDEETNWKARPDWAPDGRRVVYSSYLGRQWHQLWLMTADGANPLQLTYGEFDATVPRWSPDGRRIAYVSNERGNTSLWAHSFLPPTAPRSYHSILELGMLGTGIPSAIGAKLGAPDREVVCVTGDGAAGFNMMEMQTAAREGLAITVVVCAEGSWTMEEPNELGLYGRTFGTAQGEVRWDLVARGLGCHGEYVDRIEELDGALRRAREHDGPRVICLRTDHDANLAVPGEMLARFFEVYSGPLPAAAPQPA